MSLEVLVIFPKHDPRQCENVYHLLLLRLGFARYLVRFILVFHGELIIKPRISLLELNYLNSTRFYDCLRQLVAYSLHVQSIQLFACVSLLSYSLDLL